MGQTTVGPAARMQIAHALAALSKRSGIKAPEIKEKTGLGKSTVARYLNGDPSGAQFTLPAVMAIARSCNATSEELAALDHLMRQPTNDWWVDRDVPDWMSLLYSLEADWATIESVYANGAVPGLLQTRRYALGLHHAQPETASEDVLHAVDTRMRRQDVLNQGLELRIVLDEAVLCRQVGDSAVMAEQIAHLEKVAQRGVVELTILPFSAGAHVGGHFVLLERDGTSLPAATGVVYMEMHRSGIYLDSPDELDFYRVLFTQLRAQALSPERSLRYLAAARQEHDE